MRALGFARSVCRAPVLASNYRLSLLPYCSCRFYSSMEIIESEKEIEEIVIEEEIIPVILPDGTIFEQVIPIDETEPLEGMTLEKEHSVQAMEGPKVDFDKLYDRFHQENSTTQEAAQKRNDGRLEKLNDIIIDQPDGNIVVDAGTAKTKKKSKSLPRQASESKKLANQKIQYVLNAIATFENVDMQSPEMTHERKNLLIALAELMTPIQFELFEATLRDYRISRQSKINKGDKDQNKCFRARVGFIKMALSKSFCENIAFLETLFVKHSDSIQFSDLELTRLVSKECDASYVAGIVNSDSPTLHANGVMDVFRTPILTVSSNEWEPSIALQVWKRLESSYPVFLDELAPGTTLRDILRGFQHVGQVVGVEVFREEVRGQLLAVEEDKTDPQRVATLKEGMDMKDKAERKEIRKLKKKGQAVAESKQKTKEQVLRTGSGRSVISAVLYFRDRAGMTRALAEDTRYFGCLINGVMVRSTDFTDKTTLYMAGIPMITKEADQWSLCVRAMNLAGIELNRIKNVRGFNILHNGFAYLDFYDNPTAVAVLRAHLMEAQRSFAGAVMGWGSDHSQVCAWIICNNCDSCVSV
jgi:hypothetical protein